MEAEMHPARLLVAAMLAALVPAAAHAQSPTGVWIDHTGRGAVEITECGKALCGHVVWLKEQKDAGTCRTQVIGNVQPIGGGVWDRGWIVDPEDKARYSVELKPIGSDRLRVVGYIGTKLLSETMTWRRAPSDLQRCDVANPDVPAAATVATVTPSQGMKALPKAAEPRAAQVLPPPAAPAASALPLPTSERRTAARSKKRYRVVAAREARRIERPRRYAARRGYGRTCGVYLPYVSLRYPCNILSML
jgi:uncharacterized protein (DUF2147 family)